MSRPTRVVHILGSVNRGGAEMRTLDVLRRMNAERIKSCVVTLSGQTGELADDYRRAGVEIHPLRIYSLSFPIRLLRFLRSWQPDVVHSHVAYTSGPILLLARLAGVKRRIAHLRSDGVALESLKAPKRFQSHLFRSLMWRMATHVLAVSPSALSNAAGDRGDRTKGEVLPNGVDLVRLDPSRLSDLRHTLTGRPDEPLIVHVGRADVPTKNRTGALRFFAAYRASGGRGTLVFVGRDAAVGQDPMSAKQEWLIRAHQLGLEEDVVFLGERADVPEILAAADLLLFTSTLEGLPGVVLEARAVGTPVVSSSVPGARFLADRLPGIRIVGSLEDTVWSAAIRQALSHRTTAAERLAAHDALCGSEFDAVTTARRLEPIWLGELEQA